MFRLFCERSEKSAVNIKNLVRICSHKHSQTEYHTGRKERRSDAYSESNKNWRGVTGYDVKRFEDTHLSENDITHVQCRQHTHLLAHIFLYQYRTKYCIHTAYYNEPNIELPL